MGMVRVKGTRWKLVSFILAIVMAAIIIPTHVVSTDVKAASFSTSTTLRKGSEGTQVKYLQYGLVGLGYLKDSVDGKFGSKTETAVKSYQSANGLTVDGLAGPKTLSSLKAKVSDIQTKLKSKGYYTDTVDGVYGPGTTTAVRNYQSANGLEVDGITGPNTLAKLNGITQSTSSDYFKANIKSLYQTGDYSKVYYSNGNKSTTVSKSGCGGVALAMALNSLLGTSKYSGQNVMQWYANNGYYSGSGTVQYGIYKYPQVLGLKSTRVDSITDLESNLKKGRLVIAIVKNKTGEAYFSSATTSGHYILISGYRVNNGVKQVYVNNPMKSKTSGWFSMSKLHANVKNENDGYTYSYVVVYK